MDHLSKSTPYTAFREPGETWVVASGALHASEFFNHLRRCALREGEQTLQQTLAVLPGMHAVNRPHADAAETRAPISDWSLWGFASGKWFAIHVGTKVIDTLEEAFDLALETPLWNELRLIKPGDALPGLLN